MYENILARAPIDPRPFDGTTYYLYTSMLIDDGCDGFDTYIQDELGATPCHNLTEMETYLRCLNLPHARELTNVVTLRTECQGYASVVIEFQFRCYAWEHDNITVTICVRARHLTAASLERLTRVLEKLVA